jgi:hypothetical protein
MFACIDKHKVFAAPAVDVKKTAQRSKESAIMVEETQNAASGTAAARDVKNYASNKESSDTN